MPKLKNQGRKSLINRAFYEKLKRADRQQADEMIWEIFDKGFAKGAQSTAEKAAIEALNKFVDMLKTAPGIGRVTYAKIQDVLHEWECSRHE